MLGIVFLLLASSVLSPDTTIAFTYVPRWDSIDVVRGTVSGVVPDSHKVVLYIYAEFADGWYIKPQCNSKISIEQNSSWFVPNLFPAPNDRYVTKVAAFLVPNSFTPPPCVGYPRLPDSLFRYRMQFIAAYLERGE